MYFNEFYSRLLEILPNATVGEDNDGQLVIYTDMRVSEDKLIPFEVE